MVEFTVLRGGRGGGGRAKLSFLHISPPGNKKTLEKIEASLLPSRFVRLAYKCQLGPRVPNQNTVTSWKPSA